jgi:hypothetical protein
LYTETSSLRTLNRDLNKLNVYEFGFWMKKQGEKLHRRSSIHPIRYSSGKYAEGKGAFSAEV